MDRTLVSITPGENPSLWISFTSTGRPCLLPNDIKPVFETPGPCASDQNPPTYLRETSFLVPGSSTCRPRRGRDPGPLPLFLSTVGIEGGRESSRGPVALRTFRPNTVRFREELRRKDDTSGEYRLLTVVLSGVRSLFWYHRRELRKEKVGSCYRVIFVVRLQPVFGRHYPPPRLR